MDDDNQTADEKIRISKKSKEYLDSIKIHKRETYDDVIVRLIKKIEV